MRQILKTGELMAVRLASPYPAPGMIFCAPSWSGLSLVRTSVYVPVGRCRPGSWSQ